MFSNKEFIVSFESIDANIPFKINSDKILSLFFESFSLNSDKSTGNVIRLRI